ncbi:hypothetical protein FS749_005427, partial [Ceratobasidium sp. UAMH 11750]
AKDTGLIPPDGIDGEADLPIVGPTLCLYYAALGSGTSPPSAQLPHFPGADVPKYLQPSTCPFKLLGLFNRWTEIVPNIQCLSSPSQTDLQRIICNQLSPTAPLTPTPLVPHSSASSVRDIANRLRSIATDILRYRFAPSQYTGFNSTSTVTTSLRPESTKPVMLSAPYRAPYQAPDGISLSPMNTHSPSPWQPSWYGPALSSPEQDDLPGSPITACRSPSPGSLSMGSISSGNDQSNFRDESTPSSSSANTSPARLTRSQP